MKKHTFNWPWELIQKKKYKSSVKVLHDALEWPENIGVGKPYNPEQRKEKYLLAYCYKKLGNKSLVDEQMGNIINYTKETIDLPSPEHYLGLMALKVSGKEQEADALLSRINNNSEIDNEVKQWINDQYMNLNSVANEAKFSVLVQIANLYNE